MTREQLAWFERNKARPDRAYYLEEVEAAFWRLLEERKRLLEAAKRAQSVGEIKFKACVLAADVHGALAAAVDFAEASR